MQALCDYHSLTQRGAMFLSSNEIVDITAAVHEHLINYTWLATQAMLRNGLLP